MRACDFAQLGMAKAQEEGAELKPTPLPYEMELVEMRIKGKKFVKIMQGKEPSQVRANVHVLLLLLCNSVHGVFGRKMGALWAV